MYGKIDLDIFDVIENEFDDNLSAELSMLHEQSDCKALKEIINNTLMGILLEHKCRHNKVCLIQEYYYLNTDNENSNSN